MPRRPHIALVVPLLLLLVSLPLPAVAQVTEEEVALYSRGFDMIMIGRFETGMSERTNEALSQEPAFIEDFFDSLDDAEYEELTRRERRDYSDLANDFVGYTTEIQRTDVVVILTYNETSIVMVIFNEDVDIDVMIDLTNYVIERDRFKRAPAGWDREFLDESEL